MQTNRLTTLTRRYWLKVALDWAEAAAEKRLPGPQYDEMLIAIEELREPTIADHIENLTDALKARYGFEISIELKASAKQTRGIPFPQLEDAINDLAGQTGCEDGYQFDMGNEKTTGAWIGNVICRWKFKPSYFDITFTSDDSTTRLSRELESWTLDEYEDERAMDQLAAKRTAEYQQLTAHLDDVGG